METYPRTNDQSTPHHAPLVLSPFHRRLNDSDLLDYLDETYAALSWDEGHWVCRQPFTSDRLWGRGPTCTRAIGSAIVRTGWTPKAPASNDRGALELDTLLLEAVEGRALALRWLPEQEAWATGGVLHRDLRQALRQVVASGWVVEQTVSDREGFTSWVTYARDRLAQIRSAVAELVAEPSPHSEYDAGRLSQMRGEAEGLVDQLTATGCYAGIDGKPHVGELLTWLVEQRGSIICERDVPGGRPGQVWRVKGRGGHGSDGYGATPRDAIEAAMPVKERPLRPGWDARSAQQVLDLMEAAGATLQFTEFGRVPHWVFTWRVGTQRATGVRLAEAVQALRALLRFESGAARAGGQG